MIRALRLPGKEKVRLNTSSNIPFSYIRINIFVDEDIRIPLRMFEDQQIRVLFVLLLFEFYFHSIFDINKSYPTQPIVNRLNSLLFSKSKTILK